MPVDVISLLGSWPIPRPAAVERMGGTNNLTWRVATSEGPYILRIYANTGNRHRVAYEHELLLALSRLDLSFAVPAPLVSNEGRKLVSTTAGEEATSAVLFPVIPGRHPSVLDPAEAELAGTALGELHSALVMIRMETTPGVPTYREIEHIHPLVPDPECAVQELPIAAQERDAYVQFLERVRAESAELYRRLPRQIIHSDLARSNVLLDGGRVSGVLDFEFAGPDLRALDLAIGLRQFAADTTGGTFRFSPDVTSAFMRGYRRWIDLQWEEEAALPALLRLRSAVSVIHRLGRMRAGLATVDDVASRLREDLRMRAWLREHGERLL